MNALEVGLRKRRSIDTLGMLSEMEVSEPSGNSVPSTPFRTIRILPVTKFTPNA